MSRQKLDSHPYIETTVKNSLKSERMLEPDTKVEYTNKIDSITPRTNDKVGEHG